MTNEAKIHLDMQGYTENIMSDDSSMDIKYKGENYSFSIGAVSYTHLTLPTIA